MRRHWNLFHCFRALIGSRVRVRSPYYSTALSYLCPIGEQFHRISGLQRKQQDSTPTTFDNNGMLILKGRTGKIVIGSRVCIHSFAKY